MYSSPLISIELQSSDMSSNQCLHFEFKNKFTKEASLASAEIWSNYFNENPNEHFDFIWDCREMTGFEMAARTEWYNAIKVHKIRIANVKVIANSLMIRSAAKVMLQFFSINSVIVRSMDSAAA